MAGRVVGRVQALARYPVKSLAGDWVGEVSLTPGGVDGDRTYAVYGHDGKIGSGKTTRRFRKMPGLLEISSARLNGITTVRLADGSEFQVDDPRLAPALSAVVGEPVELRAEAQVQHKDDAAVHLVTSATLRWVAALRPGYDGHPARFRPNVVVDAEGSSPVEQAWLGSILTIGGARLRMTKPTARCVMAAQAQRDLPLLPSLLSVLKREVDLCLGVYAEVEAPGPVRTGDLAVLGD
ncbi:MAG: MOSC domain-containing protein [Acidimicrobiales bacterium]